jgi:hypothetical protein
MIGRSARFWRKKILSRVNFKLGPIRASVPSALLPDTTRELRIRQRRRKRTSTRTIQAD